MQIARQHQPLSKKSTRAKTPWGKNRETVHGFYIVGVYGKARNFSHDE